jgi:hypothetical protein
MEYNARPHRYQKHISRADIWWQSINSRGGIIKIPQTATSTIFNRHPRVVRGGYLSFNNKQYEVIGLDEGAVWVYEGIFNDKLIVEHIKTHKKYKVNTFTPLSFGQTAEIINSEAEQLLLDNPVLLTKSAYEQPPKTNIMPIPVRSTEKNIDDPFQITPTETKIQPDMSPIFTHASDRYEYLINQRAQGIKLTNHDIEFMKFFQQSPAFNLTDWHTLEDNFKHEANS